MKIKYYFLLIVTLLLIVCSNCKPGSEFTDKIVNNSNKVVIVKNFKSNDIEIKSNSEFVDHFSSRIRYRSAIKGEFCPCEIDVVIIIQDTNYKLIKNINDCNNWQKTKKRKFYNRGEFSCTFTIEDLDIVPK